MSRRLQTADSGESLIGASVCANGFANSIEKFDTEQNFRAASMARSFVASKKFESTQYAFGARTPDSGGMLRFVSDGGSSFCVFEKIFEMSPNIPGQFQ